MTWELIEDPKFLNEVQLVDLDLWSLIIFPKGHVHERREFWDKQNKKFIEKMTRRGNGHFTWQMPDQYLSPSGETVVSHMSPEPHFHYYVGKSDTGGMQFRIPLT